MTTVKLQPPWYGSRTGLDAADAASIQRLEQALWQPLRRAGLAASEADYQHAFAAFFAELDRLDAELGRARFLDGRETVMHADQCLAELLVCFELIFYGLYKLNRQRLSEFSNLSHYCRDVVAQTRCVDETRAAQLKASYYLELERINPLHRVPLGNFDWSASHDRELRFGTSALGSDRVDHSTTSKLEGEWMRKTSRHQGAAGRGIVAEPDRYHLYIANNCPWSHRAALARSLKGLEHAITLDVLFYTRDAECGWQFRPSAEGCSADSANGCEFITEIYALAGSKERSVPLLWDKKNRTIVSNESAEIIRLFNREFSDLASNQIDLYPAELRPQIDRVNAFVYHAINNGAYKAGFASGQTAYEDAYRRFFAALEVIEQMLAGRPFLLGQQLTEADVRLFPTIFRFDAVYFSRFNLNQRMIRDIAPVEAWRRRMIGLPEVSRASNLDHCRRGYFGRSGNNFIPLGPIDSASSH